MPRKTAPPGPLIKIFIIGARPAKGQITAQGDRQIFEQFDRLDEVRALMDSAGMPHRRCALSRLATRLVHERLQPVTDPALRRAFIDRAGAYFAAHDLTWDWDGASDIDLRPGPEISPSLRYTVLVQAGDGADQTRRALAAQRLPPDRCSGIGGRTCGKTLCPSPTQHPNAVVRHSESGRHAFAGLVGQDAGCIARAS